MRQLALESEDREMTQLQLAARARGIDPIHMTKTQLIKVLKRQKLKWRTSPHQGRSPVVLRAIEAGAIKRAILEQKLVNPASGEAARAKRWAGIMSVHGMWKDDPDKPQDAVAYQREARDEWR